MDDISIQSNGRRRIALYGKGGIGKSTISSNLTAALTLRGQRVLQIGCDPKHDSTRLLTNGSPPITVLDYLRYTPPQERRLDHVMGTGFQGCHCVEAGGPEPGVGCAGRGIISAFDLLEELGIEGLEHDITIYDVLGDVVCGGFAVPLRDEYADTVYVVTSGEFMSLYAANNILRGVANYDPHRIGGIIFNSRGDQEEEERVERFSQAVGVPVVASVPRSPLFLAAEKEGVTLVELKPEGELSQVFHGLASEVLSGRRHTAHHLSEQDLESVVLGISSVRSPVKTADTPELAHEGKKAVLRYTSRNVDKGEILHGCAFSGAAAICMSVQDLTTILHGPDSCAHLAYQLASNGVRRSFLREGTLVRSFLDTDVHSTSMQESCMVFGGVSALQDKMEQCINEGSRNIAVITSCPAGIIGDDVVKTMERMSLANPDVTFIPLIEDGNMQGDHMQGVIDACIGLSRCLIEQDVEESPEAVNLVGIKPIASNCHANIEAVSRLISMLGLQVNCRYIGDSSLEQIRAFRRAPLSLLMSTDRFAMVLKDYLVKEQGATFSPLAVQPGMRGTERWLRCLAEQAGITDRLDDTMDRIRSEYQERLEALKPHLKGRSVYVLSMHKDIDWLVDLLIDLEVEIQRVRVLERADHSMDYDVVNEHRDIIEFESSYDVAEVKQDVRKHSPQLLLTTYLTQLDLPIHQFKVPLVPDLGHLGALNMAEEWALSLRAPVEEGWRKDAF
ncbi:MAG: nitrogenase component 1 [Candidatus Methanomethylophilaceae archaeon]|nr:nitrogenase component 1 [Candidatus Methanomethylophilaceae archaeon]